MKLLYCIAIVALLTACHDQRKESNTQPATPGNSGGSDIIGMDTMRMDTSMGK